MKIVLSRKGFDSSSGGGPSPIVDGVPVSLPIPSGGHSSTTWDDLGLADHMANASRGKLSGAEHCHHDPMFPDRGNAILGQCPAAQSHLENQGVGNGDTFLFFGLFAGPDGKRHHRIFGWMEIERIEPIEQMDAVRRNELVALGFPHAIGMHAKNDTAWSGPGGLAQSAPDDLRLTVPGGPLSRWRVPSFMRECGLSYHGKPERWHEDGTLAAAARGQEFVCDAGDRADAREWLESVLAACRSAV